MLRPLNKVLQVVVTLNHNIILWLRHEALGLSPAEHKPGLVVHAYNPHTREVGTG